MGYMDEYEKALEEEKKKKKRSSGGSSTASKAADEYLKNHKEDSYMETYRDTLATLEQEKEDVPITTRATKKEKDERKWFQKGAFEDGYQFGDVVKTILGSATDVRENLASRIFGMGESVVDTLAYLGNAAAKGQYYQNGGGYNIKQDKIFEETHAEAKKATEEFIKKDLYDEEMVAKKIISDPYKKITGIDAATDSVFGEKSDSLVQSGGQLLATAGLQAVGVPWWLTTGATSFGSEAESALNQGATFSEAGLSASISAGAEILTEKLSGGIKFGGKTLDDALLKPFVRGISNKTVRLLANAGIDAVGEGGEEILSGLMSAIGQKLTYMSDKELGELFTKEEAAESFIGGFVLGGVGNVAQGVKANAQGVDAVTGLTENEQKVVDEVIKKETEGKDLSAREKAKIYDEVLDRMDKGYIDTDTIESVLGDKTYLDNLTKEAEEFDKLYNTASGQLSKAQMDRLAELEARNKENPYKDLMKAEKGKFSQGVYELVKDSRLGESYNERARRGQAFEADLSQYDTEQQQVIQKAIDSGILNNTNRTHEFVDVIAKISTDKGVLFDFTNNAKLKESGFAVDGRQVNGFVTKDGITLNIDSPKAWQSTVGHEITHVLEGTEMYDALKNTIFEYAKSKGEYDSRLAALTETYKGVDADIEAELTADLVGDYLFQDGDFIKNLSTQNRNVFQKIYDEIKYLCKVVTAGSKEAKELAKVQRAFEKAYREAGKASGDTKYSLADSDGKQLTKEQQDYFKDSKMRDEKGNLKVMYHGSQDAGFHVFDASMSDDNTSFFFVDSNDVAASYSGTYETYEAKTIRTAEDMNKFLAEIGHDEDYSVTEQDGQFILLYDGERVAASDTAPGIYKEFCWYEGVGEGDANYKVYLNLTNPLEVDAEGRNWDNVSREFSQEVYDAYQSLTEKEKDYLRQLASWEDYSMFRDEILDVVEGDATQEYEQAYVSAYNKLGGKDADLGNLFAVASEGFTEEAIRENAVKRLKTRDYAAMAKAEGYDGVIFKNIVDIGGYGGEYTPSTVAIAFDSNQIKSVANEKPTGDKDIRYSLSDKDYLDAVNRGDTEAAQMIVDEAAAKAGYEKLYYHGTGNGDFTKFKTHGKPAWVTADKGYAKVYADNKAKYEGSKRVMPLYAKMENTLDLSQIDTADRFLFDGEPTTAMKELAAAVGVSTNELVKIGKRFPQGAVWQIIHTEKFADIARAHGFDSIKQMEFGNTTYGVLDPAQLKSAETVTRNWKGVIPLSERFNAENKDIRYSLSDSEGRQLSPAVQKRFVNSKVVDEDGNLKPVFHGTASGEFTIFDKAKGSVEGDFGSGFYFTDNEADVSEHYEGGGPDFENKVARLAEQIEGEEEIDYEEAEKRARAELYKGSHKFEVYLNIENPAIVGETMLMDGESYMEQYNEEDYDDYDDYLGDVEQLVADDIDNIVWEVERNCDVDNTEGISGILWDAYANGGIGIEELKAKINELYLEDSNGNFVGNEVARQIIESLGYDGIIDPTVSTKWNMDMEDGTTHYIVFKPNQIKSVTNANPTDNPDIHHSLSEPGEQFKKYGSWNVRNRYSTPAKDLRLEGEAASEDIAPIATVAENATPTEDLFPSITPIESEIEQIQAEMDELNAYFKQGYTLENAAEYEQKSERWYELEAKLKELEQQVQATDKERLESLTDAPPEVEAPYYESQPVSAPDPFAERDIVEVGKRKVKAYMYEHPEVKPFFQAEARGMLGDLHNSIKGERWYNDKLYYESGGEKGWMGTKRHTTADIAELLDTWGYTYDEIEKGLNAIIEDNGAENNAVSKRIEFMLDDHLRNGFTDVWGEPIPPNQEYINLLNEMQINDYSKEAFDAFMANADKYAPPAPIAPVKPLAKATPDTMDAPIFESKDKDAVKGQTTMFEPPKPNPKVANVLTEEAEIKKEKSGIGSKLVSALVDKGMVFENLSLETGNMRLQSKYNYALPSNTEARAQYLMEHGDKGVKSLKDIKARVEKSGKTAQFYDYLYHVHNIDRMTLADRFMDTPNKPVFGETVTAAESRKRVAEYERANPEFKAMAEDVYRYNRHLRKMLADSGVISRKTAALWQKMYPHYVPIRRVDTQGQNISVPLDSKKTGVNNPVKRATGGSSDIMPLFETMAQRTEQTFRAIARNSFGIELKNTLGTTINAQEDTTGVDELIDTLEAQEEKLLKPGTTTSSPTFTVFENGERVEFEITEDMFNALKPAEGILAHRFESSDKKLSRGVGKALNARRNLLTVWNPVFALYRNPIKDIQDVAVNSQHAAKTYANIPNAIYQMATNGEYATEYHKNGGKSNTYFDSRTNKFKAEDNVFKKIIGMPVRAVENAGEFIEEIPRLAEYIASRQDGRSVERSMLDAARVTTNFAAGGDFTKFLNSHGFTFLNASVQGASQHVRNFREAKQQGLKGYTKVLAKYVIAGLPTILLNGLLWDDDEEYEELSDYVKQNYYVVAKTEDGKFVRIPKGRTAAVMGELMNQMEHLVTGDDEADFSTFFELFMNNIAPNNPIENNILAPIMQVANNEAWYGGDLVPSRLQDLPSEEQYDESTDSISKWLGEKTGTSPYKWNYLIDQYSGGLGDVFLPMLTPEAESGDNSLAGNILAPWKKEITTDKVLNNKYPGDFYDLKDELEKKSNSSKATEEDTMRSMFMQSVSWDMSDLYNQKREIQNSDMTDAEKYEKVMEIQEQINALAKGAMSGYNDVSIMGKYSEVGDRRYNYDEENGKWYEIQETNSDGSANFYYEKEQEVTKALGISYEEYWNNREEYNYAYDKPEQYQLARAVGGYDAYRGYTSELWDIKADKDENGKSISGSRKEKVIDYLNELDADYYTKIILFKNEYNADDTYNYEIIDYLNSRDDISYKEMETILKYLGFDVDSHGNISW